MLHNIYSFDEVLIIVLETSRSPERARKNNKWRYLIAAQMFLPIVLKN